MVAEWREHARLHLCNAQTPPVTSLGCRNYLNSQQVTSSDTDVNAKSTYTTVDRLRPLPRNLYSAPDPGLVSEDHRCDRYRRKLQNSNVGKPLLM